VKYVGWFAAGMGWTFLALQSVLSPAQTPPQECQDTVHQLGWWPWSDAGCPAGADLEVMVDRWGKPMGPVVCRCPR
jgi:hypothetical protein